MNILVYQMDIVWHDVDSNLEKIASCLADYAPADMLVLPEMFLSGFSMQPAEAALSVDRAVSSLQRIAIDYDILVTGSVAVQEDGHYYNRFYAVSPEGCVHHYDKTHLFSLSKEDQYYAAGTATPYFTYQDWSITTQVCYDLRFPEYVRRFPSSEILLYVANWPASRLHHWRSLLIARAIENQCYVIGCNRVGVDGNGWTYPGVSMVVDYNGEILHESQDKEVVLRVQLDKEKCTTFRSKYPFLQDKSKC